MAVGIFKTLGGANEESVQLIYDASAGRYKLKTTAAGSGSHYALGIHVGANEGFQFTTSRELLPIADNISKIGSASFRLADLRSVLINGADYVFENKFYLTEAEQIFGDNKTPGVFLCNAGREPIAFFDDKGNLWMKGRVFNANNMFYGLKDTRELKPDGSVIIREVKK